MLHTLRFFLSSKCRLSYNATFLGSCIIRILYTGCAKNLNAKFRCQKVTAYTGRRGRSPLINIGITKPEKLHRYPLNRRLGELHSRPGQLWSTGNLLLLRRLEPRIIRPEAIAKINIIYRLPLKS
jgi:hypothetical protein